MSFDHDPSERANISGADFAMMCAEMEEMQNRLAAYENGTQAVCARTAIAAGDKLMQERDELAAKNNDLLTELNTAWQQIKTEQRLSFRDQVARVEQQRDELLAALKEAKESAGNPERVYQVAKEAIEKAEANHG